MSVRPTISAAIIALDEERDLRELLPQLDWVDEIVLVDGGSRDATVEVARSHGCRVASFPFKTFECQRNRALALAACDWVLSIDADERPTPGLVEELRWRLVRARAAGFRVPIRSTVLGRPLRRSGTQDDVPIRLIRRGAARWEGEVHERLRVEGRVERLRHWLTHRSQSDLNEFLVKMHRYTNLDARRRVASGREPRATDRYVAPAREVFRRLVYKQGLLDGPAGWAFCLLSGWYEFVLADKHRRYWRKKYA
ncbi:MAG TPA: glycosyltransferase family 2 protein [Thermoguttaceae bacterium]|nr:glycosyltransferase family 2 protein [Thermoguttaceae bacterium]